MPEEHQNTGVDQGSDAGGQEEEFNLEEILFGEEAGADEQGDAGPDENAEQTGEGEEDKGQQEPDAQPAQTQTQESGDKQLSDDGEKAFAAKWAAKKDEVRREVEAELKQRSETTKQEQDQGAPKHREMSEQEIERLAEDLDVPTQYARIVHQQQQMINQLSENEKRREQMQRERAEYDDAKNYVQELKNQNPSMPEWDDKALHNYRIDHYKKYHTVLPWKEAYKMAIADSVVSGDVTRQAQQEAINNIQRREKEASTLKGSSTKKPTIDDLSTEQFEQLAEEVKSGKYKRS